MTCPKCSFNPKNQREVLGKEYNHDSSLYKSYHWNIVRKSEYFPSEDKIKNWEEIECPICNTVVHSTL